MPRHLYPGYRPDRTVTTSADSGEDYTGADEEEEGNILKSHSIT
jgi:hypothetical protein